ncbi:MAG: 4'-phosphopantetheinyl transferase superfamily protein [candidate division WOR-3 bacterium]|nr:4'-phosphopantetheinyl transferase superfamily protein [candidate division WOR-3 bacterium]
MIKGLGIDISAIERFNILENRAEFQKDVFTPDELNIVRSTVDNDSTFALLFSIKEAFLKALRCGLHFGYFWRNIDISPRLEVKTSGRVKNIVKGKSVRQFHISAAKTKRYAVGIIVLESDD